MFSRNVNSMFSSYLNMVGSDLSIDNAHSPTRLCLKRSPDTVTLQRDERYPYMVLSPTMTVM